METMCLEAKANNDVKEMNGLFNKGRMILNV
jgi:hypothetical protein